MDAPVDLVDFHMRIYFGMSDESTVPVLLDPGIGRIDLWLTRYDYDQEYGLVFQSTPVPSREIDFLNERDTALSFYDGLLVRGVYQAVDLS